MDSITATLKSFKNNNNKVYLFGSRARNTNLKNSDVDVIIISNEFKNIPFRQRMDKYLDAWTLPYDLEILCYTPEEIERKKKEIGIVQTALNESIEIT
ncbi:MAG: nucleotidyltransferase domain-containing protein [Candidatus Woesearchaeota archaeon]